MDIPKKLVRLAHQPLAIPFALLYNESILFVTVPDVLNISKTVPVYKGGIMTESGNYKPISTLSPLCKTFERLIYNQLLSFVEKQDILHQFQFGFRKGYSTEKATTSQARVFTYARRCDRDPGSGWSRDSFKNLFLCVVGKVSNYMLPHTSDTFQMQGARCNGCEK